MKQVLQNLRTGATEVAEVPAPVLRERHVLVRTRRTLLSPGTERMLVDFGKAGWLEKARQQPDKVRMVLDKVRTDGLVPTLEAVLNKLDRPLPLGYCNVGEVLDVGGGVTAFAVGDRVVSNGNHAEVVSVPMNLCAKVPDGVADDDAVFTVVGAVALQGLRLAQPNLGESVVVTGLGLVGLLAVQLLRAHGCRVLALDFAADRLALARQFGAQTVDLAAGEDAIAAAQGISRERGVDAVIIAASTDSDDPVRQAARMCRKRGRIVLVGVSGLKLSRDDFYAKELSFQVSCSYGPGRYDPQYEEGGHDYPVGFVRWTEQRNFEAVLDMIADARLTPRPLVSHRFPIERAQDAYALVSGSAPSLGIVLEYSAPQTKPASALRVATIPLQPPRAHVSPRSERATLALIGAGNYAGAALIPAFKAAGARLKTIASAGGVSAVHAGRKFAVESATTDAVAILRDDEVNAVVIATRHDSHARLACEALRAGKHVFVEKPLGLALTELQEVEAATAAAGAMVMVGFNRRFAPHVRRMAELLEAVPQPKAFIVTVNAGAIAAEHWTQDALAGGGRILGEACHFIDLLRFLSGSTIVRHDAAYMRGATADTATIQLGFADGSIGTIHYFANGNKAYPKERVEVFAGGRVLRLDNFRRLEGWGWRGFSGERLWRQDKGQRACAAAFVAAVEAGGPAPIPLEQILEVSRVSIEVAHAMKAPA